MSEELRAKNERRQQQRLLWKAVKTVVRKTGGEGKGRRGGVGGGAGSEKRAFKL